MSIIFKGSEMIPLNDANVDVNLYKCFHGRYYTERELGRGKFGSVYLVSDQSKHEWEWRTK
jgi:hypothetical protein